MSIEPITDHALSGRSRAAIVDDAFERPVHRELVPALRALQADARAAGFELALASGFRDYDRQLAIWNGKATGQRPLLDDQCRPLAAATLEAGALLHAILRWSALPGASRHHWGSDIDVYDRAALAPSATVELVAAEVADDGPFGPFHRWLDDRIASGRSHGFFRPYATDRGGVAPERWHLSYAPLAVRCQAALDAERLWRLVDNPALALREEVWRQWPTIHARYVEVPASCYPPAFRQLLPR